MPTVEQAQLVLKLYDLRRETVMRDSRNKLFAFWPKSFDEIKAVMSDMSSPLNTAYRQVTGYWEMAYSFAKHGVIDPAFLIESNGEGIFVYSKFEPFLKEIRENTSPTAFANTEWIANTEPGKMRLNSVKAFLAKMAEK